MDINRKRGGDGTRDPNSRQTYREVGHDGPLLAGRELQTDEIVANRHGYEDRRKVEVAVAEDNMEWLQRSLVGTMTKPMDFISLSETMVKSFPSVVQIRDMGAHKALLIFDSVLHAEETYNFHLNGLLQVFHRVLIDTCIMDVIHEWIHIIVGAGGFDVLVKEIAQETCDVQRKRVDVDNGGITYEPLNQEITSRSPDRNLSSEEYRDEGLLMAVMRGEEDDRVE
ncbi:hypothetical protein AHAS_Ahas05G0105000 [Arachis hypogaea]